ncbi:hypothetical protein DY000_02026884 [Brassica cretica]|uniref:Uncharacterized protein n=1 Tax=Brassica cretica TaxID=69181 RepID=A0ABQ7EFJ8_BRACR|nr:hypothetical protein DY000_02026884 [Brassica cretica]
MSFKASRFYIVPLFLLELNPGETSGHVQMSNLYASSGRWDTVMEVRAQRVSNMTEVDGAVHEFLAGEGLINH